MWGTAAKGFLEAFQSVTGALTLRETTIDKQFRSRDVAAVVGGKKYHGLGDLKRCWAVSVDASRSRSPGVSVEPSSPLSRLSDA